MNNFCREVYKQGLGFEGLGGALLPKLSMSAAPPSPPCDFKLPCLMINHNILHFLSFFSPPLSTKSDNDSC